MENRTEFTDKSSHSKTIDYVLSEMEILIVVKLNNYIC